MKKIFFVFTLVFAFTFVNANCLNEVVCEKINKAYKNNQINSSILSMDDDHCTVTVSVYQDGELVSSATWTDNTGDCEIARAGATMMAFSLMM